jgi:hypothetical protein
MTAFPPTVVAPDDVTEVVAATYNTHVLLLALRGGQVYYRLDGVDTTWTRIWSGAFSSAKQRLTGVVIAGQLCLAWGTPDGWVQLARYHLGERTITREPVRIIQGSSPALASALNGTVLLMAFVAAGQHRYLTSDNLGESWLTPPLVDVLGDAGSGNITEVDVTTPSAAGGDIIFAESDLPLAGE